MHIYSSFSHHGRRFVVAVLARLNDLDVRERYKDYAFYGGLPSPLAIAFVRRARTLSLHPYATVPDHEIARQLWSDLRYALSFVDGDILHDGREDYWDAASRLYTEATKIVASLAGEDAELQKLAWHYHSLALQASHEARSYKRSAEIRSLPFVRRAA